jgi:hypothetical protein
MLPLVAVTLVGYHECDRFGIYIVDSGARMEKLLNPNSFFEISVGLPVRSFLLARSSTRNCLARVYFDEAVALAITYASPALRMSRHQTNHLIR